MLLEANIHRRRKRGRGVCRDLTPQLFIVGILICISL